MTKILIHCPSCSETGYLEISEDMIKNSPRGVIAINVQKVVCKHSFIAYIDKNLHIRDYFIVDFQVESPDLDILKGKEVMIPDRDTLDVSLIKLNMSASLISYIIKSIFIKQKIILIIDESIIYNQIIYEQLINLFKYVTKENFQFDIKLIFEKDFLDKKKKYKNCMIFKENQIINNYKKLISIKKLHVEKSIVNRFINETDEKSSLLLFKNDVQKAFELSKLILDIINNSEDKKRANLYRITEDLEKKYDTKINNNYLRFLTDILKFYFEVKLPTMTESFVGVL